MKSEQGKTVKGKQELKRLSKTIGRLRTVLGPPNVFWYPVMTFAEMSFALDSCVENGKNPHEVDNKSLELLLQLENLHQVFFKHFSRRLDGYKASELLRTVEELYRRLRMGPVSKEEQEEILWTKVQELKIMGATRAKLKVMIKTQKQLAQIIESLDPPVPSHAAHVTVGKFFGKSEGIKRKKGTTLGPFGQSISPVRDSKFIEAMFRNVLLIDGPGLGSVVQLVAELLEGGKLKQLVVQSCPDGIQSKGAECKTLSSLANPRGTPKYKKP